MIAPAVGVIRHALDAGVWQWHGYTAKSRVKQVRTRSAITSIITRTASIRQKLDLMIEDLLFVHKV